ncbi:hypothetical protein [Halodesulfovibrio marinisediminis]|uniref:Uncharacterized protein n=1 Tax=Halodesulfovibrio marinisediminis DSM 17456 TaxID=1121457 RepID=A0A1N6DD21_9BACT|nr:hypothetical protein [Halodesulfovibrio marinisediminis]SIN68606.1 hypothetical protein SAMN02745161_0018 [Halodesulfovibrio marinisediminis DSM 17456]
MLWNELFHVVGQDWMLFGLAFILLFMFIRRALRVGGFLGFTGVITTAILLAMLTWLQWNKYQVGNSIVQIITSDNPSYRILTPDKEPMFKPVIVTIDNVRYITDAENEKSQKHLPWRVIAMPK